MSELLYVGKKTTQYDSISTRGEAQKATSSLITPEQMAQVVDSEIEAVNPARRGYLNQVADTLANQSDMEAAMSQMSPLSDLGVNLVRLDSDGLIPSSLGTRSITTRGARHHKAVSAASGTIGENGYLNYPTISLGYLYEDLYVLPFMQVEAKVLSGNNCPWVEVRLSSHTGTLIGQGRGQAAHLDYQMVNVVPVSNVYIKSGGTRYVYSRAMAQSGATGSIEFTNFGTEFFLLMIPVDRSS